MAIPHLMRGWAENKTKYKVWWKTDISSVCNGDTCTIKIKMISLLSQGYATAEPVSQIPQYKSKIRHIQLMEQ